jgi:hypothetical protein
MAIQITLNRAEQVLARYLAEERFNNARQKGKPNEKVGDQPDWYTDLNGIGGEIAVAKHFNAYPDTELDLYNLPDHDLIIKHKKVDVKTTKYSDGRLLATLKKKSDSVDVYILVTGEFPTYSIVKWCFSEELIHPDNIMNLGRGDGYALDQEMLRDFKD